MISLKKYLDMDEIKLREAPESSGKADPTELAAAVLDAYRAALVVMGKRGEKACPPLGADLNASLAKFARDLKANATPSAVREMEERVENHLQQWGSGTAEYFRKKTDDVKELLIVMARTAESVGRRDQRYASQFNKFTVRLQAIANLEDLANIRASLVAGAAELKTCVDQMSQDTHEAVAQLRADVSNYETRLKAVEQLAVRDPLTGLANRRYVEERIGLRVEEKQTFCIAILDLNRFKKVNDTHGHPAGDEVLKQFSQELRSNSRPADIVGRWGGDEFILILDCPLAGAESQLERVRQWVYGEYSIPLGAGKEAIKVHVDASVGLAQWKPGETMQQVIERADAAMYQQKELAHKQKPELS